MDTYETMDLIASNREIINANWQFFISLHLALVGVMYISTVRVPLRGRLALIIPYVAFLYMNYQAQVDYYTQDLLLHEYWRSIRDASDIPLGPDLDQAYDVGWINPFLPYIYMVAAFFGGFTLLMAGAKRPPDSSPEKSKD